MGEILERTDVNDWNWISTKYNVADDGTRASGKSDFDPECRWYTGPAFLRTPEKMWPRNDVSCVINEIEEVECCNFFNVFFVTVAPDASRFSKWLRYIRETAC